MSAKIVVLYPHPTDPSAFERDYHGRHMPLMRQLVAPAGRVPTFAVKGPQSAVFYRMAEIHFDDLGALITFARSEDAQLARRSSESVSTGGTPLVLICERDAR